MGSQLELDDGRAQLTDGSPRRPGFASAVNDRPLPLSNCLEARSALEAPPEGRGSYADILGVVPYPCGNDDGGVTARVARL